MEQEKQLLTNVFLSIYNKLYGYSKDTNLSKIQLVDLVNEVLAELEIHSRMFICYNELREDYEQTEDPALAEELLEKIKILVKAKEILEEQHVT